MTTSCISWVHIGDLHMDEADGWQSRDRLQAIVADINAHIGDAADFVFLPGDNANHATVQQYRAITDALAQLRLPVRVIPGDHDFEGGNLDHYRAAFSQAQRADVESISGHRCIFLDMISQGAGGPDFRLTRHHHNRLLEELAYAQASGQTPIVFMHAYPCDLAADGDRVARMFAEGHVAFVDTGHTHYNELLNDGRVVYGATRSTGQIEEDGGKAGFSMITVYGGVPSWRFKTIGSDWPFIQIISPADIRLVTRPTDARHVPRPGMVDIVAKLFGAWQGQVSITIDGGVAQAMDASEHPYLWRKEISLDPGLHNITVIAGMDRDTIRVLVRDERDIPRRDLPVVLGHPVHTIGAWPERGIDGFRLGPNWNGKRW